MYCPKCYNNTLCLCSQGVVNVILNEKQMDTGRFVFNLKKHSKEDIYNSFSLKLEEFFSWYSTFQNKDPINYVKFQSSDFVCEDGCKLQMSLGFSVIDILVPRKLVLKKLVEFGEKYKIKVELKQDQE